MDRRPTSRDADAVTRVVIVGGGTAGWMAATALSRFFGSSTCSITLVESDAIGTVGVGEATIPPIVGFNSMMGIPEEEFMRETRATYKTAIEFVGWGSPNSRYMHPFGAFGQDFHGIPFHQLWYSARSRQKSGQFDEYSMSAAAARAGRFAKPGRNEQTPLAHIGYAFHFDATLYAAYLRRRAEHQGVKRQEGRIVKVHRNGESGDVASVELEDGTGIDGDIFLDCSGFRGLLIEEALETGYEDWSQWLPMDRALAMPTSNVGALHPHTRATAHAAGWQWRIPLQHRTGNGHVFCSSYMDADEAERILMENVDGEALAEPRLLKFSTGMRKKAWNHNVISLGLSSGFIEPLESTSIHLIQQGVLRFVALFPERRINPAERDEYNANLRQTYEYVRDFVIMHYKANRREDSEFWRAMQAMEVPDSLQHRLDLWQVHGRIFPKEADIFVTPSWAAVLFGQEVWPERPDQVVDGLVVEHVDKALDDIHTAYRGTAARLPTHEEYLRKIGAWSDRADARPD
ncbi:tryptophan halogenase family protein [Tsuneonella mangrovi]|uniref:tryptophan halogenase family protein n=1 Tax=Tsuneonella mangrovi TaxID=1982042 RepID=UPI000BA2ADA1|nr:tryptophan halogenase family protein [Tsuneonella mangrovi]